MVGPYALALFVTFVGLLWIWVKSRQDRHPPYDGSVVIIDLPRFSSPPAVVRDNGGRFAKGSKPLAARGPDGKFTKAA